MTASALLYGGCAAVCLVWAVLVLGFGRGRAALLPAAVCGVAAAWAGTVALAPEAALSGPAGAMEILCSVAWLALLLVLCRRVGGPRALPLTRNFAVAGGVAAGLAFASVLPGTADALALPTLGSPALLARLGLALIIVLLAENLYRNADDSASWHVNLPAIALGGLSAFDILLYADAALYREVSPTLLDARAVLTALAMSLLVVAAARDRRWRRDLPVSREVVFHGATLVVAGAFLLGVGAVGEALRHLGADWGRATQVSLLAGAVMVVAVGASSGSVRSRVRRLLVDHFFIARYDYRREWLRCVAALSAPDAEAPAPVRAICAIADPVDSPAGALLVRDPGEAGFHWAGSWNLPPGPVSLPHDHPLLAILRDGGWVAELATETPADLRAAFGPLWLGVPLLHHREGLLGVVLLAPPRAPFPLDGEVFDLLRTLGREVAMFLAERRAAERLADQRQVQDYAKRFAFVAHDVKTVASQLTLLLANADENIEDPEFQRDMLLTVRASATRINALIARLRQPGDEPSAMPAAAPAVAPLARLRMIVAARPGPVGLEAEGQSTGMVAMTPERFDAAVTHLLDNAQEASRPGEPVRVRVRREAGRIVVDIIDQGMGMTPEFIRDELFRPLSTSKPRGNGIGAWQARELLREAGGDLTVLSRPGVGTTMRLVLPVQEGARAAEAPVTAREMPA